MNIVSLLYNRIQILGIKKRLLGKTLQYTASVETTPEEALNLDLDKLGLSLKRALSLLPEKAVRGKVKMILGQVYWQYYRIELPVDITSQALSGFIKEHLFRQLGNQVDNSYYHHIIQDYKGKKYAGVYLLTHTVFEKLVTLLTFYDLKIEEIYPEALLIFELFSKTLNKQKEEAALFLEYEKALSTGLLFNSTGLLSEKTICLKSENLAKELKEFKKSQTIPISRLILGGKLASEVRQDNFTKESGIWTNPLEKVLQNSPLKTTATKLKLSDKLLLFNREIKLLDLIANKQQSEYSLNLKATKNKPKSFTQSEPPVKEPEIIKEPEIVKEPEVITEKPETQPKPAVEPSPTDISPTEPSPSLATEESIKQPVKVELPTLEQPKRSFKPLLKILLIVLISSALTYLLINLGRWGLNRFQNLSLPKINLAKPTSTPTPKPTPKETPTPKLTREQIEIEILNGTGVAGMASSFQNELEDLGYNVLEIGNADNYDYEQTVIISNSQAAFSLLKKDLAQFNVKNPEFEKTNQNTTTVIFGNDLELP